MAHSLQEEDEDRQALIQKDEDKTHELSFDDKPDKIEVSSQTNVNVPAPMTKQEVSSSVLYVFCISIFLVGISTVQVPLYYPLIAHEEKGMAMSFAGLMLSLRPICGMIITPFMRRYIVDIGVENTILYSGIIYGTSFLIFGFIYLIDNYAIFVCVSILVQVMSGCSFSGMTIGEQCLLLNYSSKEDREFNTMMFRIAFGIGGALSALFGAIFYSIGGYIACFTSVGGALLIAIPFIYMRLKKASELWQQLNGGESERERRSTVQSMVEQQSFGFCTVIGNKEFFFAFNSQIVLTSCLFGCLAVNNLLLSEIYGFSPNKASICYSLTVPAYALGGYFTVRMFQGKICRRRALIQFAFVMCGISQALGTGDWQLLTPEPKIYLVLISMCTSGFGAAMAHVLAFPEMVSSAESFFAQRNQRVEKKDMDAFNSSMYCLIQNLAQMIGPALACSLQTAIDFNWTYLVLGMVQVTFGTLYVLFVGAGEFHKDKNSNNNDQQQQQKEDDPFDIERLDSASSSKLNDYKLGGGSTPPINGAQISRLSGTSVPAESITSIQDKQA